MRRNKTFRYIHVVDKVKWTVVGFSHCWLNCYEGWNGNREHGNNEWNTMGGKMVNRDTCKRNDRYQTSDTSTAKNRKGKLQEATPTEQIETEEWTSQWRPARRGAQWYVRSLEARPPSVKSRNGRSQLWSKGVEPSKVQPQNLPSWEGEDKRY